MPKAALSFPLLAILALGGCATSEPASNIGPPPAGQSERSGEITPWGLTYGAAVMTSKVYPHLAAAADANANLFISPVSLSQGLGLAYLGARGGTREEIGHALGWDSARNVPALIKSYNTQLTDTGDADTTLGIANALWLAKGLPIRNEYVAEAHAGFGVAPETVDYAGNPAEAAERINGWVSRETRGRISQIVSPSGFGDDTAAVLTNALYFKAKWQVPFEETETRTFTRGDGSRIPITMMKRIGRFDYRETREGQAIALPYGGDGFVMEIFLPRDAATLRRWERELKGVDFFAGEQGGNDRFDLSAEQAREMRIVLPRFEARFDESVKAALIAAGMSSAFDQQRADLSGIASGVRLAIDDVAHATFLRIDEEGTEAAAATAVKIVVTSARIEPQVPEMVVDRPFLATLRDRKSGAVLFFGRIADPTAIP
ncbi:serpin family protein [Novosphingobium panipatense]|uniref:Serpin B n=1 Tax=Novosphingobium panipatense TaxID=428991 RepID=A0ABY1QY62_9SPHN|nr:serpin family protein [Novosphingobium panipatense]SMP82223.1 serpin B [Novosphingobium panipatense]